MIYVNEIYYLEGDGKFVVKSIDGNKVHLKSFWNGDYIDTTIEVMEEFISDGRLVKER